MLCVAECETRMFEDDRNGNGQRPPVLSKMQICSRERSIKQEYRRKGHENINICEVIVLLFLLAIRMQDSQQNISQLNIE